MIILNSKISAATTVRFLGTSDGNTGCWQIPDTQINTFSFSLRGISCAPNPFLCNPIGTAVLASGLAGPYQWQNSTDSVVFNNITNNVNYSGTNTANLSLSNITSNRYGEQFRCIDNGITGQIFTLKFRNTWTGAINSDWGTAGNWSCGTVPDDNTDVVINSGTIVLNMNTTIRSLIIKPTATLTVNTGFVLTIVH